jgi:hypothetical protein
MMWFFTRNTFPIEYGISFNQDHAESLGHEWQTVYEAMLRELEPRHVRVAAMWSDVEPVKDEYNFSSVDWMMDKAAEYDAKVLLVVGQKAPRWPECHVPEWLNEGVISDEDLAQYITAVVERYREHPALDLWQVENEPFIKFRFGECEKFREDAVHGEIALVKRLDSKHKILVTDSGELSTWWQASRAGDLFGTTMYRIVQTPSGKIFAYDWLPAAFYRWKARMLGRSIDDVFISELQAEPWFTGSNPTNTPVEKQEETMDPERMEGHIEYAARTGFPRAYLWGVEWWYFMKENHGDPRYWETAKAALARP